MEETTTTVNITVKKSFWSKVGTFLLKVWTIIENIVKWFATVLEDQANAGSISSKRVVLFIAMFIFYKMYQTPKALDPNYLWADLSLILVCLGVITSEFFCSWGTNGFSRQK